MNSLLENYGFRTTLRVWAVALIVLSSPLIYYLRPRLPISPVSQPSRYGLGFLRTSTFWIPQVGLIIESSGYFIPSIYLPTFARSLGLSPAVGTLLVALVNAAAICSSITMGFMIDHFHVTTVILLSTVGAASSVFLFWGLSSALPMLVVFSILYGIFAGGFVSTNVGVIKEIRLRDETADVGMVMGLLSAGRGIGAVISGPLSAALLSSGDWHGHSSDGYGSAYGGLIVFTGMTAVVGSVSFFWKRLGWM